jgi:hypothetical protein
VANGRMFDELGCEGKQHGYPEGTLMANVWRHMRKSRWCICGLRFMSGTTCVFVILCFNWCIAGSSDEFSTLIYHFKCHSFLELPSLEWIMSISTWGRNLWFPLAS